MDPWFTNGLLVSRRNKIKLEKIASFCKTPENINTFKNYRNLYNKIIRLAKKMYFDKQLAFAQSDMKKTWKLLRYAINRKSNTKTNSINSIFKDNILLQNPLEIANTFNEFFTTVPLDIVNKLNPVSLSQNANLNSPTFDTPAQFSFDGYPISEEEIFNAVSLLAPKKSLDYNNISMFFIKKCIASIVPYIKHVFNLSIDTGIVPSQLKIAKIVPVLKNGDPRLPDNYRPIALLSNFSKIIEKIIYLRLYNFLDHHNLITSSQFGFRPNHSTIHPMILLSNFVSKAFNEKKHVLAIFCDLRKAFDTVNHDILLRKLHKIGIRGMALNWFENYLCNRKQFVTINNINSSLLDIVLGVPQGSILGPLLFLIYINDLPYSSLLTSFLFADDTTLLHADSDIKSLYNTVNAEFSKITNYFRQNLLSIHPGKTKYILFSSNRNLLANANSNNLKVIINDNNAGENNQSRIHTLERITGEEDNPAIKFLGLYIDPNLNFKFHTSIIRKKISSALFFMRKAKHILNKKALTSIYYALVHSHLIYAIQVWSTCSQANINMLFKLQKKAIRLIHNLPYNGHTESFFKKSKILPLPMLIDFFKIQFMNRFVQGFLPHSFAREWTVNAERNINHSYHLRNENDVFIPFARTAFVTNSPYHSFPRIWIDFNVPEIKIQRDKFVFNKLLKNHFCAQLKDNYVCTRLLCPHCLLFPSPNNPADAGNYDSE